MTVTHLNRQWFSTVSLLLALMVLAAPPLTAGVYRWVDENGKVHFTDRLPPGQKSQKVKVGKAGSGEQKRGTASDAERRKIQQKLLDSYRQDRQTKKEAAAKKRKTAQKREVRCAYAKNQLQEYRDASQIYVPQIDGSRKILSAKAVRETITQAEEAVEHWCD